MIIEILALLLFNSLYIFGLHAASDFEYIDEAFPEKGAVEKSKMILWRLRYWSEKYIGAFYTKPLASCPICMSSIHSSYFFWPVAVLLYGFHLWLIPAYILYVGILAGVNLIVSKIINLFEAGKDYLNNH